MRGILKIFGGNSNPALLQSICDILDVAPGKALVSSFSDGEVRVEIHENVRGKDVYLLQSTCHPINRNVVELLVLIDAVKRASASRINVVIPYYGYGRKDQKDRPRVPITAKLIADLLSVAGAQRVIAVDLHANQIQGFFNIPVDNLFAAKVLLQDLQERFGRDAVIVAPDAGGVERARAFAKRLHADLAIIDRRYGVEQGVNDWRLVGDVKGRTVVILDDMIDTGRTLLRAMEATMASGASEIHAYCVHPVLSGSTVDKVTHAPLVSLTVTDTIPLSSNAAACGKIRVISVAPLLAETIRRAYNEESVSSLFV
ncbi:MAG TPA: phosphoribosylpyrophosphate synthetase [Syntrophobacteraceae bacterium]|nr:phosphoribosylpyrophosphate synthetase [Syntrophobacteraceae bacterium]HBZ56773.1 phosphoribosylpyrophosphate synthetase [Syntrophobacteraceae bacterium]